MLNPVARLIEPTKLLIIVGIAYTLATTGLYFLSTPESATSAAETASGQTLSAKGLNVAEIANLHLFGSASTAPVKLQADNYAAPETRLKLELLGVFQATEPRESAAIVAERSKPGQLYKVGDKMPGNAVLAEVYVDRIVIRRAGVYETLRFSEESPLLAQNASSRFNRDNPALNQAITDAVQNTNRVLPYPALNRTLANSSNIKEFLTSYKEQLEANPEKALASVGLTAVAPGESRGYRLGNLANSPQLSRTGLQPNDVILSVNGQAVGNVQQDQMQLDNVLAQGTARLEVQRGSRRFFVSAKL